MTRAFPHPLLRLGFIGCVFCFLGTGIVNESTAQDLEAVRKAEPFSIRGTLSAGMWLYSAQGIASRRQPFSWYLTGAPVVSIYGITFPFTLTVSEQERRFAQPFNRYGVSPYYKWLTVHAGYRNVKFSDFTLAGVNMLGGGFEINSGGERYGKLRIGAMAGRINRAVAEDTTSGDPLRFNRYAVFKRSGYAFKISVGTSSNYIDLLLFKGRDDTASIQRPVQNTGITPADNAVAGLKIHNTLFKKLTFDADVAASVFTSSLYARPIEKDNEDFAMLRSIGGLVEINASSGLYTAARAGLNYGFGIGSIAAQYERIDQNFQSLGAFFFNNDNEQLTLSPTLSLLKNKLSVSGSYGVARDNLNGKKYATTLRTIGSANIAYLVNAKLNLSANIANFGTNQSRGTGDLFNDTTAIHIVNNSYGFNAGYTDTNKQRMMSINLTTGYQDSNDQNRFTRDLTAVTSFYGYLSGMYMLLEKQTTLMVSLSYNDTKTPFQTIRTMGPVISAGRSFFDKKLRASVNATYFLRQTNAQADGSSLSGSASVAYTAGKHTFTMGENVFVNSSKTGQTPSFTEIRTNLLYSYTF